MTSINISVKRDAYSFLKSLKTREKSFSDIILEFKEKQDAKNVMRFFGKLRDVDWNERQKNMAELRKEFEER